MSPGELHGGRPPWWRRESKEGGAAAERNRRREGSDGLTSEYDERQVSRAVGREKSGAISTALNQARIAEPRCQTEAPSAGYETGGLSRSTKTGAARQAWAKHSWDDPAPDPVTHVCTVQCTTNSIGSPDRCRQEGAGRAIACRSLSVEGRVLTLDVRRRFSQIDLDQAVAAATRPAPPGGR